MTRPHASNSDTWPARNRPGPPSPDRPPDAPTIKHVRPCRPRSSRYGNRVRLPKVQQDMDNTVKDFADLFANQPLSEAALLFLPVWLLALYAGLRGEATASVAFQGRLARRFIDKKAAPSLTLLPLLLWAGISMNRTLTFWHALSWSHGPDSREIYPIAIANLGAGAITCFLITAGFTFRGRSAARLGLRGTSYFTSILLILSTFLDAAFLLHFSHRYTFPAGIPLPMSMVQ